MNVPQSPSSKSPERKKQKPHSKPRKTYVFQPSNTLAYNPQTAGTKQRQFKDSTNTPEYRGNANLSAETSIRDQNSRRHPLSSQEKGSEVDSAVPENASLARGDACLKQPSTPFSDGKIQQIFEKMGEQQSSDDSFDGVRWKVDKKTPQKDPRPLLSSPLKNIEFSSLRGGSAAPLSNEITGSILTRYGMTVPPILSQTPANKRTISEGVVPVLDISPTLARSKSFDTRNLLKETESTGKASRLNTWIDKFTEKPEISPPKATVSIAAPSDDGEDVFSSDDDALLANLNCNSLSGTSSNLKTLETSSETKSKPLLPQENRASQLVSHTSTALHTDESDPFSDDLDIAVIDTILTQPSTAQSSFSVGTKKSTRALDPSGSKVSSVIFSRESTPCELSIGPKISYSRPDFARYQVQHVFPTEYHVKSFTKKQLVLTVVDQGGTTSKLVVRGESADLEIKPSDIVHVILTTPETPHMVSDTNNLLIWHPDTLVSSTTVADQLDCPRKTVLNKRLSSPGSYSIPLLAGTIIHEIFQLCFVTGKCTKEYMESLLDIEVKARLLDIYTLGDVVDELKAKVREHLPYVHKWFHVYLRKPPTEIPTNKRQQKIRFSVAEILDIEERVLSPMFGIKGIADVTLKANLESDSSKGQFLLPMEIKTGQPYISHQAQAALYSLLFKDRYNVDIASFLLVYTSGEGSTIKHDISVPDLKSLINLRNRISAFLRPGNQELPGLMRQQKCDRCFVQQSCMTYDFLVGEGNAEKSGLKEGVYEDLTVHLEGKPQYKEFLELWDYLLSKEEEYMSRFEKELWVFSAKEREEKSGKSLSSLVISACEPHENDYVYTFRRRQQTDLLFTASQISKYDRVIISDESGHFALASGYVRHIGADSITVTSKRQIISTESKSDKFHRAGVLRASQRVSQNTADAVIFRLDKDEMFYGMGVARYNVLNLFQAEGDHARRELIVDLRPPTYSSSAQFRVDADAHFNECQLKAFDKVSKTNDYSLILGMPGTGKTTVIACLIKILVAAKKTVLLTSYTHSAVDNILIKVKEFGIEFLRIGSPSRVHSSIKEHTPGSEKNKVESYADFQNVYSKPFVVAATCLGVQDPCFTVRDHFDYCIVDEASQVSMPISLGPLALCDKFILVGDHFQLPPLVSHPDSKIKAGLSQSLFQILANAHPHSVVELKHQYRMCEDIMLISNKLVYKNRLVCGNEEVANQSLEIPNRDILSSHYTGEGSLSAPWLEAAFEKRNKVVFYDHDLLPGYERSVGENTTNLFEVELVRQTVEALCASGVDPHKIGIMTLYRSQLKLLVDAFRHVPELEILTADRFQGRDKDCIIISMVRSNRDRRAGDLLKDWRRINVAVTRARSKLIVFGSVSTLSNAESVSDFVDLARREGWVYELPHSSLGSYHFDKPSENTPKKARALIQKLGAVAKHQLVSNILADIR